MWVRIYYQRDGRSETIVFYARNNQDITDLMDALNAVYERYIKL